MSDKTQHWWPSRPLQRTVHAVVTAVLGLFIYSPLGSTPRGESFVRLAVFPALVVSGLFAWKGSRLRPFLSSLRKGEHPVPQRLVGLLIIILLFGIGHHVDHIIRGNHVGWPLTPEINAFTFSLLSYPFIALGLYLGWRDQTGVPYWTALFLVSSVLIGYVHFGPSAIEPPADIITVYENALVGWFAFAWVVGFTVVLVTGLVYSSLLLVRQSGVSATESARDE